MMFNLQNKPNNISKKPIDIIVFLILMIAVIVINMRMIRDGLNGMIDMRWHITWLQHFSKQISEGILYPRWLSGTNYGYGSPTFVFYPPLVYYLGSFVRLIGIDIKNTLIILYSLSLFLSGFNCYLFCQSRYQKLPSLVGAICFMTAPYLAYNLYWVSSLSVAYAIAWIPLGFWLTDMSLKFPKWKIALAFFWTVLALTHLPNLLLFAIVWLGYILYSLKTYSSKKILSIIFFSGIGLSLASFFLIPAVLEQKYVDIASMKSVIGNIENGIFGMGLPFIPKTLDFQVSHILFHQSLVILALFAISLIFFRHQKNIWKSAIFWFLFSFILFMMMSFISFPIWQASSILQKIQAPWRLFSIFSFTGAVLCANTVSGILRLKNSLKIGLSLVIVFLILFNLSYSYKLSRKFPTFNNSGRADLNHLKDSSTALFDPYSEKLLDVGEYRPVIDIQQPSPAPILNQPKISVIDGKGSVEIEEWKHYSRKIKATINKKATIKIRTYNYPAWHLYVNDRSQTIRQAGDGTILVDLEPGNYNIVLKYQKTPAFKIGIIISSLGIIVLIILSILM